MEGYTQLDYIESDGRQWIDAGFSPADYDSNLEIIIQYQMTSFEGGVEGVCPLFGALDDDGAFYAGIFDDSYLLLQVMSSGFSPVPLADFNKHTLKITCNFDNQSFFIDGVLAGEDDQLLGGGATSHLYFFGLQTPFDEMLYTSKMRVFSITIKDTVTDTMIRQFIPAKNDETNEVGLYDMVTDAFYHNLGTGRFRGSAESYDNRELDVTQYDLEIWDWKSGLYVADISNIVVDGINISWVLNDIETLNFNIDLIQFEKKCALMGVTPEEVLTPYVHDIRVRRNGEYILGAQVVETNIKIENDSALIEVKCTGFLNLFKDQYISESWGGYTYAEIARKLVERGQHADCLIKNPTIDIDSGYWLSDNGSVSRVTTSTHGGSGKLQVTRSGTGWNTCGTKMDIPINTPCKVDIWVAGQSGVAITVVERSLINNSTNQQTIASVTPSSSNSWTHITGTFTTRFEDGYLYIQQNRTSASYNLWVDDCYVYRADDDDSLNNLNVALGVDTASTYQLDNRERNYALQNVKDALMDLTALEDDNFDFDFSPDRTFNCYHQKGDFRPEVELVYPQNIHSLTITRSASNLANKIIGIGSGIGDERLQIYTTDTPSRQIYGTRESILTNNNVTLENTLIAQAEGELRDRKSPVNLPNVVICDGSVNPSNTQVGDILLVRVDGDEYLGTINGYYRIMQYDISINAENAETVTLTLELVGNI